MACGEIRITRERKPAHTVAAGSLVPVLSYWKPKAMGNIYFAYADREYASLKVQAFTQRGYGQYHERYVRRNDAWKIASIRLVYLQLDINVDTAPGS